MTRTPPPFLVDMRFPSHKWPSGVLISVDAPRPNDVCESFGIEIKGFVARLRDSGLTRPRRLKFTVGKMQMWATPINLPRPDVLSTTAATVDPGDMLCGFNTVLPTFLSLRDEEIDIVVVHDPDGDGNALQYVLGSIRFLSGGERSDEARSASIDVISVNSIGRSGSSMLCRVLEAHGSCFVPKLEGQYGEVSILSHYLRAIAVLSNEGAISELNKFDHFVDFLTLPVAYLKTDHGDEGQKFGLERRIMSATRDSMLDLFFRVVGEVGSYVRHVKPTASYWVEKSWNLMSTNISQCLPIVWKEIFLVRDIRSFWRSQMLFQEKIRLSPESIREHAQGTYSKYVRLAESYLDRKEHALLVRYEDLIANPSEGFSRIFEYLKVPFDLEFGVIVDRIVNGNDEHRQLMKTSDGALDLDFEFDAYLASINERDRQYLSSCLRELGYD